MMKNVDTILDTDRLKHSKLLMHVKRFYVFKTAQQ